MRFASSLTAVDAHAAGEPGRVIIAGIVDVPGATMFEKMRYFQEHHDDVRLRMLREPRGYAATVPTITGPGWITGFIQYVLDPKDPFPTGYTVGDIWGAGSGAP